MKKIVSNSLYIFLVMTAMVFFTGGTEARAQSISDYYAGSWVGYDQSDRNDNPYIQAHYALIRMDINSDETVYFNGYSVTDMIASEWVPEVIADTDQWTGTASESADHVWLSYDITTTLTDGTILKSHTTCTGSQLSGGKYQLMQCIAIDDVTTTDPYPAHYVNVSHVTYTR